MLLRMGCCRESKLLKAAFLGNEQVLQVRCWQKSKWQISKRWGGKTFCFKVFIL